MLFKAPKRTDKFLRLSAQTVNLSKEEYFRQNNSKCAWRHIVPCTYENQQRTNSRQKLYFSCRFDGNHVSCKGSPRLRRICYESVYSIRILSLQHSGVKPYVYCHHSHFRSHPLGNNLCDRTCCDNACRQVSSLSFCQAYALVRRCDLFRTFGFADDIRGFS